MACSCKELDEEVLNDAKAFLNGEVTIQDLMSNPTKVDGDRAKLIDAIHTLYKDGSNHEDFMRAIDELKEVAEKGDIYLKGVTVEKNVELAKKYYKLAADRKLGEAFHNLALLEEDEKKANELEDEAKLFGYNKEDKTQNYLLLAFQK